MDQSLNPKKLALCVGLIAGASAKQSSTHGEYIQPVPLRKLLVEPWSRTSMIF
jgi:hypothetical protein